MNELIIPNKLSIVAIIKNEAEYIEEWIKYMEKYHVHKKRRLLIYGISLLIVLAIMLFLTFQNQDGTVKLSESVRLWFEQFGYISDFHSFRSNAHLVVYFVFGTALSLLCIEIGIKWWKTIIIGCAFGLIEELIKIILPTREFDIYDFIRDCIGVIIAYCIVSIFYRLLRKKYEPK